MIYLEIMGNTNLFCAHLQVIFYTPLKLVCHTKYVSIVFSLQVNEMLLLYRSMSHVLYCALLLNTTEYAEKLWCKQFRVSSIYIFKVIYTKMMTIIHWCVWQNYDGSNKRQTIKLFSYTICEYWTKCSMQIIMLVYSCQNTILHRAFIILQFKSSQVWCMECQNACLFHII